jgi:trimeric autotransporter adhesin
MSRVLSLLLCAVILIAGQTTLAQNAQSTSTDQQAASIPFLLRHSGVARDITGAPMAGVVTLTFSVYRDEADQAPLWQETQAMTLSDGGRYSAIIGSETRDGVPLELFVSGQSRWIGIRIQGQPESVRTMLISVPYALKAEDANTLGGRRISDFVLLEHLPNAMAAVSASKTETVLASPWIPSLQSYQTATQTDSNTTAVLQIEQYGTGYGLNAVSAGGAAVLGQNSVASGLSPGVMAVSASNSGPALYALATSVSGSAYGVQGASASTSGVGVWGQATAQSGSTIGVVGYSASPAGVGVKSYAANIGTWAEAYNSTGDTTGLIATAYSPNGIAAVFGNNAGGQILSGRNAGAEKFAVDGTGNLSIAGLLRFSTPGTGIVFPDGTIQRSSSSRNVSTNDVSGSLQATQTAAGSASPVQTSGPPSGVRGTATAQTGAVAGVLGESISPAGNGIIGLNSAQSGDATGVAGYSTTSPSGIGVYGEASSTDSSGTPTGVLGLVNASGIGSAGVWGYASATTGETTGVTGSTVSPDGYGVEGDAYASSGLAIGVAGFSDSDEGRGVLGSSTSTTGQTYGVRGLSSSDAGTGVAGLASSVSGNTVGLSGEVASPSGVAGMFTNTGGGDIVVGRGGAGVNAFRIDAQGKGYFNGGTVNTGADFAEMFSVRGPKDEYEPGDLLSIDETGVRRVKRSDEAYSTQVAGVYSTRPGIVAQPYEVGNAQSKTDVPLAVIGVVPLKVTAINGDIHSGDLLVASPIIGRAMKGTDRSRMLGAVVGKALQSWSVGEGVIQVLVILQ